MSLIVQVNLTGYSYNSGKHTHIHT